MWKKSPPFGSAPRTESHERKRALGRNHSKKWTQENGPENASPAMKRLPGKLLTTSIVFGPRHRRAGACGAHFACAASPLRRPRVATAAIEPVSAVTRFVEEHAHFDEKDPAGAVRSAVTALGRENAAMIVFQISRTHSIILAAMTRKLSSRRSRSIPGNSRLRAVAGR